MLTRGSLVAGLTLVLAMTSVGCASSGKIRLSASTMCKAHGGTYDTRTKSCTYTAVTKSAKETCEAHDGFYDVAADVCEIAP
jgi:hypothetical protein